MKGGGTDQRLTTESRKEYEEKNTTTPSGTMVHAFSSARPSSSIISLSFLDLCVNSNCFPLGPRDRFQARSCEEGITCPQERVVSFSVAREGKRWDV